MTFWGASHFPTAGEILAELDRQELRRPSREPQDLPEPVARPRVSHEDLAAAWRAVGSTDEVLAFATVGRYWWKRALVGHARHARPEEL